MRNLWIVLLATLAVAAVAGGRLVFSGKIEDWNDNMIDEMTFIQQGPWGGDYDAVQIEPVDMSHAAINGNEKGKAASEEAAKLMNEWCQKAVRENYGEGLPKMLAENEEPSQGARVVTLRWVCESIDPGSRAKRFWVGFGAGHSGVTLSGSLIDKASGKELVAFKHCRISGKGFAVATGGRYNVILNECAVWTAQDVGSMLGVVIRTKK